MNEDCLSLSSPSSVSPRSVTSPSSVSPRSENVIGKLDDLLRIGSKVNEKRILIKIDRGPLYKKLLVPIPKTSSLSLHSVNMYVQRVVKVSPRKQTVFVGPTILPDTPILDENSDLFLYDYLTVKCKMTTDKNCVTI